MVEEKQHLTTNRNFGDLIDVEEFRISLEFGLFTDYDGYGYWATDTHHDEENCLSPSQLILEFNPPSWATHILWFNR